MANKVIQLKNKAGTDNLFPIAGGTTQNTVTRGMLAEGVFEGNTLSEPSNVAYVATTNIQDGAVTTAKIADGAVDAGKIDFTTIDLTDLAFAGGLNTTTGANGTLSFTSPDVAANGYLLVLSKTGSDGTAGQIFFIRLGATAIIPVANNSTSGQSISVSGDTITVTGVITYARWRVYKIL